MDTSIEKNGLVANEALRQRDLWRSLRAYHVKLSSNDGVDLYKVT